MALSSGRHRRPCSPCQCDFVAVFTLELVDSGSRAVPSVQGSPLGNDATRGNMITRALHMVTTDNGFLCVFSRRTSPLFHHTSPPPYTATQSRQPSLLLPLPWPTAATTVNCPQRAPRSNTRLAYHRRRQSNT